MLIDLSIALAMSYTVSSAMVAPARASISTPVRPIVRTVASTRTPGMAGSVTRETATSVRGRGWHSGISSAVRLAAMMPATRATPSTSPFAIVLPAMASSVAAVIRI
jgi:hypothetical protein